MIRPAGGYSDGTAVETTPPKKPAVSVARPAMIPGARVVDNLMRTPPEGPCRVFYVNWNA